MRLADKFVEQLDKGHEKNLPYCATSHRISWYMTNFFHDIERQPEALRRIAAAAAGRDNEVYQRAARMLQRHATIYVVGMGASWHAGMAVASYLHARGRVALLFDAAELLNHGEVAEGSCVLLLSRSGKSKELVDLAEKLRERQIPIVSVTNDGESPMARASDLVIELRAPFDTNVSVTMYSGIALAGCLLAAEVCGEAMEPVCAMLDRALEEAAQRIPEWARRLDEGDWLEVDVPYYFLGRGAGMASCTEARLLWEEAAKSTATALTTAGFRHGPQEMAREGLRVAIWLDKDHKEQEDLLLATDLSALGAKVLLIGQRANEAMRDGLLAVPEMDSEWQFVVDIIPIQIAAERLAVRAGRDCDSFRLCSYVVTDEGGLAVKRHAESMPGEETK